MLPDIPWARGFADLATLHLAMHSRRRSPRQGSKNTARTLSRPNSDSFDHAGSVTEDVA